MCGDMRSQEDIEPKTMYEHTELEMLDYRPRVGNTEYYCCKDCGFIYWRNPVAVSNTIHQCPAHPEGLTRCVFPEKPFIQQEVP